MAAFLGTGIAIFLIILGMYRDPYVPYMAPGLQAHLIFLAGMEIVYLLLCCTTDYERRA